MKRKIREYGLIAVAATLLAFEAVTLRVIVPVAVGVLAPGLWASSAHAGTVARITSTRAVRLVRRDGSVVALRLPVVVHASTCPRMQAAQVAGTVFSAALHEALL